MDFFEFLKTNYIWILVVLILLIITIIGFFADRRDKKNKKQKDENKETAVVTEQLEQPKVLTNNNINEKSTSQTIVTPKIVTEPVVNNNLLNTNPIDNNRLATTEVVKPIENNNGVVASEVMKQESIQPEVVVPKTTLNTTSPINITSEVKEEPVPKVLDLDAASKAIDDKKTTELPQIPGSEIVETQEAPTIPVEVTNQVETPQEEPVINGWDMPKIEEVPAEVVIPTIEEPLVKVEPVAPTIETPIVNNIGISSTPIVEEVPVAPTIPVEVPTSAEKSIKEEPTVNSWEMPKTEEVKTELTTPTEVVEEQPTEINNELLFGNNKIQGDPSNIHRPVIPEIKEAISNLNTWQNASSEPTIIETPNTNNDVLANITNSTDDTNKTNTTNNDKNTTEEVPETIILPEENTETVDDDIWKL